MERKDMENDEVKEDTMNSPSIWSSTRSLMAWMGRTSRSLMSRKVWRREKESTQPIDVLTQSMNTLELEGEHQTEKGTIDVSLSDEARLSPKLLPDMSRTETPLVPQLTDKTDIQRIMDTEKNTSTEPVLLLAGDVETSKKKKKKRRSHKTKNVLSNMFSKGITAPTKHQEKRALVQDSSVNTESILLDRNQQSMKPNRGVHNRRLGNYVNPWAQWHMKTRTKKSSSEPTMIDENEPSKQASQSGSKKRIGPKISNRVELHRKIRPKESDMKDVIEPSTQSQPNSNVDIGRISFSESSDAIKRFLENRPSMGEVKVRGILRDPQKESELRREKQQAKLRLSRRLSRRPSQYELVDKGILLDCNEHPLPSASIDSKENSTNSIATDEDQGVHFAGIVRVGRTYPRGEYERGATSSYHLSLKKVEKIKREINTFKRSMDVHEASSKYTHFYK